MFNAFSENIRNMTMIINGRTSYATRHLLAHPSNAFNRSDFTSSLRLFVALIRRLGLALPHSLSLHWFGLPCKGALARFWVALLEFAPSSRLANSSARSTIKPKSSRSACARVTLLQRLRRIGGANLSRRATLVSARVVDSVKLTNRRSNSALSSWSVDKRRFSRTAYTIMTTSNVAPTISKRMKIRETAFELPRLLRLWAVQFLINANRDRSTFASHRPLNIEFSPQRRSTVVSGVTCNSKREPTSQFKTSFNDIVTSSRTASTRHP